MNIYNDDSIDEKERKKVDTDHTIEIEIYVKLRLVSSNYLTRYDVL